jgi:hypothetical protein
MRFREKLQLELEMVGEKNVLVGFYLNNERLEMSPVFLGW